MRIELEHTAAIAIDYQEKLMPAMSNSEAVIRNASILFSGLRELGVPVHTTQQYTKGLGNTVPEILEVLENKEYIDKLRYSTLQDVESLIHEKKYIIVCGVEAHICVLQTVIDLKQAGYIPVLVADCISSRKEFDAVMAIERAKQEGAIVTTYEAILFELLQVAGTETAKKIQKLIR